MQTELKTKAILEREQKERQTYDYVGTAGRSALNDRELLLPEKEIHRYRKMTEGAIPHYSLEQMVSWAAPLEGKTVLEVCCHTAEHGGILAKLGATVHSIDIAEPLIHQAKRRAVINGVEDRLLPAVMSAHDLAYPDGMFDVAFGKASLHHLDLDAARDEILRVLKPGGIGIFAEPVVFSSALKFMRPLIPVPIGKESPDERQFTAADIARFCSPFSSHQFAYYYIFTRLHRVAPWAGDFFAGLDKKILNAIPGSKRWSGICVFMVKK